MRFIGVLGLLAVAALGGTPEGQAALEKGDYKLALKEFTAAAEAGDAEAQYQAGEIFRRGLGLRANPRMAAKWYEQALAQGHKGAAGELGIQLWNAKKRTRAVELIRQGADAGHARAAYTLAVLSYRGAKGVEKLSPEEMYALFKTAAEQGHPDAQAKYASGLERAKISGKKDYAEAAKWYRKAADQGHPYAFAGVARCRWKDIDAPGGGTNVTALTDALEWYRKAALHGDHSAQHFLALAQLARQAYTKSYIWYKIGANKKNSRAETNAVSRSLKKSHAASLKEGMKKIKQYTKPDEVRAGDALVKDYVKQIRANMKKGLPWEDPAR
ncbi:MAG: tetratricopeptide repeat protein [Planctomycetota bacterium]|jgi:TPR repeat protein